MYWLTYMHTYMHAYIGVHACFGHGDVVLLTVLRAICGAHRGREGDV